MGLFGKAEVSRQCGRTRVKFFATRSGKQSKQKQVILMAYTILDIEKYREKRAQLWGYEETVLLLYV